jgi:drug/metabolite transporter (DMT)-like permease
MKAILFAVLAGVCWGLGELATKSVLQSGRVGPMAVLLVRMAVALPLAAGAYLVAAALLKSEPAGWWRVESGVMAKLLLGSGVLAGFGGVFFFYLGLSYGPISTVKPIAFTVGPALAVVLAWALLGESMTLAKAAGVVMVLGGVVLIAGTGAHAGA